MLRIFVSSLAISSALFLDPCGSGGTGTGTGPAPSGTTGDGGTTPGTTPGTQSTSIPAVLYDGWSYLQVTMYEPGEDPIVSDLSGGTADFNRDGTYKLSYRIGNVFNGYEGKF